MTSTRSILALSSLAATAAVASSLALASTAAAQSRALAPAMDASVGSDASTGADASALAAPSWDGGADRVPPRAVAVAGADAGPIAHGTHSLDDAEDPAADRALGRPEDDLPDPIADEGERTGSVEGEPLPESPYVASEIAALSDRQCVRLLRRAAIPFEPSPRAVLGVAQPVFVTGPIGGVTYRASGRRGVRELMDCRLALTLFRWSRLLRAMSVREVVHLSTYRPPTESEAARNPVQTRHMGGMAIDAGSFVRDDGTTLSVLQDFHGRLRRPVCGTEARVPRHDGARALRTIACDSARRGLFHVVLTPNCNRPHRNHFHLEVARSTSWLYVR